MIPFFLPLMLTVIIFFIPFLSTFRDVESQSSLFSEMISKERCYRWPACDPVTEANQQRELSSCCIISVFVSVLVSLPQRPLTGNITASGWRKFLLQLTAFLPIFLVCSRICWFALKITCRPSANAGWCLHETRFPSVEITALDRKYQDHSIRHSYRSSNI